MRQSPVRTTVTRVGRGKSRKVKQKLMFSFSLGRHSSVELYSLSPQKAIMASSPRRQPGAFPTLR